MIAVNGQTRTIDQLKFQVNHAENINQQLTATLALCNQGNNLHPDTLLHYAQRVAQMGKALQNEHAMVEAMFHQSSALTTKGLIDSSLRTAERCLRAFSTIRDPALQASVYNQMGRCYMRKNQYKEAIEMGYKVLSYAELVPDTLLLLKGKTLIAWAYLEIGQTKEALTWHLKALRTTNDSLQLEKYAILFANLAINYRGLNKMDSAFFYIEKAIRYARKHENLFALSNSLAIQAQLFVKTGQGDLAGPILREVVEIRKLIGDPFYLISDMSQLGSYYANNGQPEKGIEICKKGIAIAKQYNLSTKLLFLYNTLAENYKVLGDDRNYAEALEKIIALKDTVYEANSALALADIQGKYALQRNENIIIQQKLLLSKQNFWMLVSLAFVCLGIMLLYLLFSNYKRKQRTRMELMLLAEKRLSTEAVLRAEENERKRIASDLHDNMGAYASAILANVDELLAYNMPNNGVLENMKRNAAEIMLNLRDTIWVLNKEEISITAISDRFKSYAHKIGRSYDSISIEVKETIDNDISLSPERALNMLRIMQEAFHNAIKHSQCTSIVIEIISDENLAIKIMDNGIGLDTVSSENKGNGLQYMKLRANANNWHLSIERMSPEGTMLALTT